MSRGARTEYGDYKAAEVVDVDLDAERGHGNEVSARMMVAPTVRTLSPAFITAAVCDADGALALVLRSVRPSFLMTICLPSFVR